VAYRQEAKHRTQAEQDEAILDAGVVRIIEQEAMFVEKGGLSLLEGHLVLPQVVLGLDGIP
jgi:hypothetical protein